MTEVVLVGCTNTKRDERAPAGDLYDESTLFRKRRRVARRRGDEWAILSAEHGLVLPGEQLDPYDTYIGDRDSDEWAEQVLDDLLPYLSSVGAQAVFICAGKAYVDPLVTPLEGEGYDVIDALRGQMVGERMSRLNDWMNQYRDGRLVTDGGRIERVDSVELDSQAGYPIHLHNVGGKEPDGKPTRIGKWTFATKMVRDVILDHVHGQCLNACAGETRLQKRGVEFVRNDIDESIDADIHVDVRKIDQHFESESFDSAILDPPFDPGRAAKLYEGWHGQEYSNARDAVGRLVRPGGTVVELGWNSWSLADKEGWECVEHHLFRQSSFKGDVHLVVDRRVNQQRLTPNGGGD